MKLPKCETGIAPLTIPGEVLLARAVLEVALREAIGTYSAKSKAFTNRESVAEAKAFIRSGDAWGWVLLAGGNESSLREMQEALREQDH